MQVAIGGASIFAVQGQCRLKVSASFPGQCSPQGRPTVSFPSALRSQTGWSSQLWHLRLFYVAQKFLSIALAVIIFVAKRSCIHKAKVVFADLYIYLIRKRFTDWTVFNLYFVLNNETFSSAVPDTTKYIYAIKCIACFCGYWTDLSLDSLDKTRISSCTGTIFICTNFIARIILIHWVLVPTFH